MNANRFERFYNQLKFKMSTEFPSARNRTSNSAQAFWIVIGSFSSFAVTLISASVLSRYLDKSDYGTYRQIVYVYNTLLVVFSAGLPRVFSYFLPRYPLEEGRNIIRKIGKMLFFAGAAFSLTLYFFAEIISILLQNPDIAQGLRSFSLVPAFLLPTLGIEGIFATYRRTLFVAIYNTTTRFLMLIFICMPVVLWDGDHISAIHGWLAASFLSFWLALYFKDIPFKGVDNIKTRLRLKEVLKYSTPLMLASIWGVATSAADQFYISRYFGAKEFAVFANGFLSLPFVGMITSATSVVLTPIFSKVFHEKEGVTELLAVWRQALRKSALILYPLLVFFIAYANEIMVVLFSHQYEESGKYFQINMLLNFFNIIIFAPLFISMGKMKVYSRVHFGLAIIIWITHFLLMEGFGFPVLIAINSTFWNVIKILVFMGIASRYMRVKFLDFFPFKFFSIMLLHSVIGVFFTRWCLSFVPTVSTVSGVIMGASAFALFLVLTSKLFRIDYLSVYQPLFRKFVK